MKKKIKKILNNKYLPYIAIFLIFLFIHLFMNFNGDDTVWYSKVNNLITYLPKRYGNWGSRLIIETTLISLLKCNIFLWRILDSFMITLGLYMIIKFVNKNQIKDITLIGCCLFLLYPLVDLVSAGWATVTLHYFWTFSLGMLSFLPLINYERKKKTNKIIYVISTLALIYACNQEQSCSIILGINILYLINKIIKKEKINKYNILCILLSSASLIFIFTCPGNFVRIKKETKSWLPEYKKFDLIDKIYYGVIVTLGTLSRNRIVLFVFATITSIAAYIYSKHNFTKMIAIINVLLVSSITVFQEFIKNSFYYSERVLSTIQAMHIVDFDYYALLSFGIAILVFAMLTYLLLVIFQKDNLLPVFILLGGICSRIIIGFSPTIFASLERPSLFLHLPMIITCLLVIYKLYEDKKINNTGKIILKSCLIFLGLTSIINTFFSVLVLR